MIRNSLFALCIIAPFALGSYVHAQGSRTAIAMPPMVGAAMEIFDVQSFNGGGAVTDAPFTADAVTEITQTLADGNRIERSLNSFIARDSRGRVRREEKIALIGPLASQGDAPVIVTISDPDAGITTLDARNRIATTVTMPAMRPPLPPPGAAKGDVMFFFNAAGGPGAPPLPPGAGAGIGVGVGGGAIGGTFQTAVAALDAVSEPLGTRTIEGVEAEGTRSTFTIPARAIGNVNPIDVVTERWYSKELQMAVMVTRKDPRTGETNYRLTNIVRGEPSAELFEVPADYTIRKAP